MKKKKQNKIIKGLCQVHSNKKKNKKIKTKAHNTESHIPTKDYTTLFISCLANGFVVSLEMYLKTAHIDLLEKVLISTINYRPIKL